MPGIAKKIFFILVFLQLIPSVGATTSCHESQDCSACVKEQHCTFVVTHDGEQVCASEDELDLLEVKLAIYLDTDCQMVKGKLYCCKLILPY
jgi:hypothetical protein